MQEGREIEEGCVGGGRGRREEGEGEEGGG